MAKERIDLLQRAVSSVLAALQMPDFRSQTYDATYNQEPNNNREGLTELPNIGSLNPINCNGFKKPETDIDVEDSGYAIGPKNPTKITCRNASI
ncbi:hypothetical protein VC83_02011 [Pseudogymnoascus destructans]|uniref:Uncharacterized protein n=1 Tax=Pseudogymnoascus destructans TaxID=655981 RepID=A0A177AIH6_9PEZI|nr:uncharacterized protein VC83_02011 [Pseudogymnoascus destructans]OAF61600.1 hypothetical protein VC83_02011 [Pseudogymnoascus destructans]